MIDNLKRDGKDVTLTAENENFLVQNDRPSKIKLIKKHEPSLSEEELEIIRWRARSFRKWA